MRRCEHREAVRRRGRKRRWVQMASQKETGSVLIRLSLFLSSKTLTTRLLSVCDTLHPPSTSSFIVPLVASANVNVRPLPKACGGTQTHTTRELDGLRVCRAAQCAHTPTRVPTAPLSLLSRSLSFVPYQTSRSECAEGPRAPIWSLRVLFTCSRRGCRRRRRPSRPSPRRCPPGRRPWSGGTRTPPPSPRPCP